MSSDSPIYILGLGSIGTFIAHCLRSLPNPPAVKLLVHRRGLYDELASNEWRLGLRVQGDGTLNEQEGFEGEFIDECASDSIHHLIVAVKASATASALNPIRTRIGAHTTIFFFQNGLGQLDDVNEKIFPDPHTRPVYACGILYHGVYMKSPFETILSSLNGRTTLGIMGNGTSDQASQTSYLRDILLQCPVLRCEQLTWEDLLRNQLLKLAANCVINPLTALLDVQNGSIKDNLDLWPAWRPLLGGIASVFEHLPEMQNQPGNLSMEFLETSLLETVDKTAGNSSSMREDVRKRRQTEIEYLNGWIVRRGRELGVHCPVNHFVTQLVLAKSHS